MSEEEINEAIANGKYIANIYGEGSIGYYKVYSMIDVIDKLQKVIDLMATKLSDRPLLIFKENGKLEVLEEPEKVVEYFYKKAEEEK